jgi:hypothetical protein
VDLLERSVGCHHPGMKLHASDMIRHAVPEIVTSERAPFALLDLPDSLGVEAGAR